MLTKSRVSQISHTKKVVILCFAVTFFMALILFVWIKTLPGLLAGEDKKKNANQQAFSSLVKNDLANIYRSLVNLKSQFGDFNTSEDLKGKSLVKEEKPNQLQNNLSNPEVPEAHLPLIN